MIFVNTRKVYECNITKHSFKWKNCMYKLFICRDRYTFSKLVPRNVKLFREIRNPISIGNNNINNASTLKRNFKHDELTSNKQLWHQGPLGEGCFNLCLPYLSSEFMMLLYTI